MGTGWWWLGIYIETWGCERPPYSKAVFIWGPLEQFRSEKVLLLLAACGNIGCWGIPRAGPRQGVTREHTVFYATETYIMHFHEPARFLNALDLAGRKVNVIYSPLWVFGPWNNSVLICIKLSMNLFVYMALAPYDFDAGQRHYFGNWKGQAMKV